MTALHVRPRLVLRGLGRRRPLRAAVLALTGAGRAELRRACELAAALADGWELVAVDGGLRTCLAEGRLPDLFVGDGDSAGRIPAGLPSVRFAADKDFSDLAGALAECRKRGARLVTVAGLLGGRLDHEWANLGEVSRGARSMAAIVAPTERGTVLITRHGCRAVTVAGRTLSLFCLSATAAVTLRGTRWELVRRRIRPGSLGLSNVSGRTLDLEVHGGTVALVFPCVERGKASR